MKQLSLLSAVFAFLAAILWGLSAQVYVPVVRSGFGGSATELKDGSTVIGEEPFYKALAKVARFNFYAATCAAVAAVFQTCALILSAY
jgi:hypothetical protein